MIKSITQKELDKKLEQHRLWIKSKYKEGECLEIIKTDLSGINFSNRCLEFANFNRCNLEKSDFSNSSIRWCDFSGTNLKYAKFNSTYAEDANFTKTNLEHAILNGSSFSRSNFTGASLRDTQAHDTEFQGANFKGADIDYASFSLWRGILDVDLDDKQIAQLIYYLLQCGLYSKNTSSKVKEELKNLIDLGNQFDYEVRDLWPIEKE